MDSGERRRNRDLEHRVYDSIPRKIGRGAMAATRFVLKSLYYVALPIGIGAGSIVGWEVYKAFQDEPIVVKEERIEVTRDAYGRLKVHYHYVEEYMIESGELPGIMGGGVGDQEVKQNIDHEL